MEEASTTTPGELVKRKDGGTVLVIDGFRDNIPGKAYYICRWQDEKGRSRIGAFVPHLLTDADADPD
jgi:hypothetical protein